MRACGWNSASTSMSLESENRPVRTEPNSESFRMPLRWQTLAISASGISMCATVVTSSVWLTLKSQGWREFTFSGGKRRPTKTASFSVKAMRAPDPGVSAV